MQEITLQILFQAGLSIRLGILPNGKYVSWQHEWFSVRAIRLDEDGEMLLVSHERD
jgi:hypothetical protein